MARRKAGSDYFTGMQRDYRRSSIVMFQNGMAAASPNHTKAGLFEDFYYFLTLESGKASHREICWIPIGSREPL
jgi:hypothetical protein